MFRKLAIIFICLLFLGCSPIVREYAALEDYSRYSVVWITEPIFLINGNPYRFKEDGIKIAKLLVQDFRQFHDALYFVYPISEARKKIETKKFDEDELIPQAIVIPTIAVKFKYTPPASFSMPFPLGYTTYNTYATGSISDSSEIYNFNAFMTTQVPVFTTMQFHVPGKVKADVALVYSAYDTNTGELIWQVEGFKNSVDGNVQSILYTINQIRSSIIKKLNK